MMRYRAGEWVARAVRWAWSRLAPAMGDPTRPNSTRLVTRGSFAGAMLLIVSPELPPRATANQQATLEARRRFQTSTAFGELARVATRGVVMVCRIREQGPTAVDHFVVISPGSASWM